jgi:hypothetical protein
MIEDRSLLGPTKNVRLALISVTAIPQTFIVAEMLV